MVEKPPSPQSLAEFEAHTTVFLTSPAKECEATKDEVSFLNSCVPANGLKLLNLAHDWLHRLLPHVLSKIDRVGFGLLQAADLAAPQAEHMPFSRKVMSVPFVAKDVPSRSSEFAHPDVVIGLSILAYRYEGLRLGDMSGLLTQLKQDFARQAGPKGAPTSRQVVSTLASFECTR
ncbi:Protein of unknown function (DUF3645), putative [Angomonas deanei]|uniref:ubiquitinyl hydrolase 1 n=1 Tax=Angomonas deanei TaxID=59799 RepID=A0A7G2C3Q0_9TRYP|nr:Protein of unknown function (DUF3645), putative [Angomonas deanei]